MWVTSKLKLSVIVPIFNEEKTVVKVLQKLLASTEVFEVVVVDDGSTDGSLKKIQQLKHKKLRVFSKANGGKGSAVRYGLEKVTGDYVLIQDSDLEYDPDDIPVLVEPVKKGKAEVIYGSRFLGSHSNLLFWHRVGNSFLNFVVNIMYDTTLSDMETCYKLLPTELFRSLDIKANKFDMEPEITCKMLRKKVKIYEVPITYVGRDFTEGKKITWRDGFGALWMIFKLRF